MDYPKITDPRLPNGDGRYSEEVSAPRYISGAKTTRTESPAQDLPRSPAIHGVTAKAQNNPFLTLGLAALAGFVAARLLKSGVSARPAPADPFTAYQAASTTERLQ